MQNTNQKNDEAQEKRTQKAKEAKEDESADELVLHTSS